MGRIIGSYLSAANSCAAALIDGKAMVFKNAAGKHKRDGQGC